MVTSKVRMATLSLSCVVLVASCARAPRGEDGGATILRWGDDLIAGGSEVVVSESIPGDAMLAGGEISFTGVAGGDYLGAGGEQMIAGRTTGDARAAGGEIQLIGSVGENATIAGGQIDIAESASVGRNAYLAGQRVVMAGTIGGSLRMAGNSAVIEGSVSGDVDVRAGTLRIGPGARIGGDLRYRVPPNAVTIDPGAQITGEMIAERPAERPPIGAFHALRLLGFLLAGVVAIAIFARASDAAEAVLRERPFAALGWGILWVIVVPIAAAIVGVTMIGIPLALIICALYLIFLYLARSIVALWFGRMVLGSRNRAGRGGAASAFLVGGIALALVGLIPVVGAIVTMVSTLLGLGALVAALRARGGPGAGEPEPA